MTEIHPDFEKELMKTIRGTQRKIWFFGVLSLVTTVAVAAGVIGGLIYVCQLLFIN